MEEGKLLLFCHCIFFFEYDWNNLMFHYRYNFCFHFAFFAKEKKGHMESYFLPLLYCSVKIVIALWLLCREMWCHCSKQNKPFNLYRNNVVLSTRITHWKLYRINELIWARMTECKKLNKSLTQHSNSFCLIVIIRLLQDIHNDRTPFFNFILFLRYSQSSEIVAFFRKKCTKRSNYWLVVGKYCN